MSIKPVIAAIAVAGAGLVTTKAEAASYAIDLTLPCSYGCAGTMQAVGSFTLDPADVADSGAWSYDIQLKSSDTGGTMSFTEANSILSFSIAVTADNVALTLISPTSGEGSFNISAVPFTGYIRFSLTSSSDATVATQYQPSGDADYAHIFLSDRNVTFAAITNVPAPAALPLMAGALAGLGWLGRRRRRAES